MKNSIKVLIAIFTVSVFGMSLKAQNGHGKTGIYQTEQDYKTNHLSYILNDRDKLTLNEFLDGKKVSLNYEGKKVKLSKNEIFGYKLNDHDFRFYHNQAYRILDTAGFLLYSHEKLTQSGKGYKPVNDYYFSVNTAQPVLNLTMQNLSASFAAQTEFRYQLQSSFNGDADLIAYDKFSHQYKIKHLYFQQKQVMAAHN